MPRFRTDEDWRRDSINLALDMKTFVDRFGQEFDRVVREKGLTENQYRTLAELPEGQTYTETDLSGELNRDLSRTGKALKGLESKGFVSRRSEEGDRRKHVWQSTEAGREKLQEIRKDSLYVIGDYALSGGKRRRRMIARVFEGLNRDSEPIGLPLCDEKPRSRSAGYRKKRREELRARKKKEEVVEREGKGEETGREG